MMRTTPSHEAGTVTLFVLGLCVAVLFLGGLGVDLWRAVAVRRELSSIADAAATAGANAVVESELRAGRVVLDRARAESLAVEAIRAHRTRGFEDVRIVVDDDVTVTLRDDVPFSLLGIFLGGDEFVVQVRASAEPREVP
jgi:Flp pilus assembly protein TadG